RLAGLVVGFLGLALLMLGRGDGTSGVPLLRMGSLVLASVSWALGSVLTRGAGLPVDGSLPSAMSVLAGGGVALGVGLAGGELARFQPNHVSAASLLAWGYLVVFGSMLAFTCFAWLVRVVDPARFAAYAYVTPMVALPLGWWLAGEPLGARTLLATPIILLGLVLVLGPEALPLPRRCPRRQVT